MNHKPRVLFLSVGDSTRSQIAEGFLRTFAGDEFVAISAATCSRPQFVMTDQEQRQPSLRTVNVYDVARAVPRFFHPVVEHNLIALLAAASI